MASTKRELNKLITKEKIIKTSLYLFANKGLDNVTISDIVKKAEIGRGTFYNYFKTTKEVFAEIIDLINKDVSKVIKVAWGRSSNLYEFFKFSFKAYFDLISSEEMKFFHKNNQNHIRSVSYSSSSILGIVNQLQVELELHENVFYKNEIDYKLVSFAVVAAAAELAIVNHQFDFEVSNEKMAHLLANIFAGGIEQKS